VKIEVKEISKRFGATLALDCVSLTFESGEIHTLVGENGAGKSTLGKIISGVYHKDSGTILINGQVVEYASTYEALQHGITIIAQELSLVPARSVIENVFLGIEDTSGPFVARKKLRERFSKLVESSGIYINPDTPVAAIRNGDQQKVEILRALARNSTTIVMDEPTARLSADETSTLKQIIRDLKAKGHTIIFVSHFLNDVLEISDKISIMRDGRLVRTSLPTEENHTSLVEAMTGTGFGKAFPDKSEALKTSETVLKVNNLTSGNRFKNISLEIKPGEILGIAGLVGSGRTELVRSIFGVDRFDSGSIEYLGETMTRFSPAKSIKYGVSFLPESRKDQGIIPLRSLSENISLPHLRSLSRFGWINKVAERGLVDKFFALCGVKAASPQVHISTLSGGNQQKALFARSLAGAPKLFIADEPTRGVDVGSKRAIYDLLAAQAAAGMAILVVSSELDEIVGLTHRVLVMREGQIVKELAGNAVTENAVLEAAFSGTVA
jgi:simple sugar transport system ATP-binding protein/ribose transport system ATP-binding protein